MYHPEVQPVKEFLKEPKTAAVCSQCKKEYGTVAYFCRTTGNHGFAHVVDSNEIFCCRWLWAAVIAVFAGTAIFLIHSSVTNLVSQTLTTEFVERSDGEQGNAAILPDIHICDSSIFNMTRLADMGLNSTMATYLTLATSDNAVNPRLLNDTEKQKTLKTEFDRILAEGPWTLKSLIEHAAINCEDMVLGCSQAGAYHHKRNCCEEFFDPVPHVSIFGSCITTHGKTIQQVYPSRDAGFVVYVLPNTFHVINFDIDLIKPEYILQKGLYYAVSSPAVHIGSVLHKTGRFAAPFSWVSLPITKSVVDNRELKNNALAPHTCLDTNNSINIRLFTPNYDYYSKQNCFSTNWQNSTQLCEPHHLLDPKFNVFSYNRSRNCPIQCVEELYDLSPSYADFNFQLLTKDPYWKVPRRDPVVLHFFYPSFQYQARISHTNTYLKWLGEVGGNLGLFLGASLISILEIIVLLFRCCIKSFST